MLLLTHFMKCQPFWAGASASATNSVDPTYSDKESGDTALVMVLTHDIQQVKPSSERIDKLTVEAMCLVLMEALVP